MTRVFDPVTIVAGSVVNLSRRFVLKGVFAAGTLVVGTSLLTGAGRAATGRPAPAPCRVAA